MILKTLLAWMVRAFVVLSEETMIMLLFPGWGGPCLLGGPCLFCIDLQLRKNGSEALGGLCCVCTDSEVL